MKIVISGSSGFVGGALVEGLTADGHDVIRLRRCPAGSGAESSCWDPEGGKLDASELAGAAAVINLNGANIGGRRWTPAYKSELRESRLRSTSLMARTLAAMDAPPPVLINASAVGVYGDRGDEPLTEASSKGDGFLADLAADWEAAAAPAIEAGVRVVFLRLGMVLGRGGALDRMLLPFRMGLGGPIGGGEQWWPWIALEDVVRSVRFLLERPEMSGPVNAVAPEVVTSREFAKILGRVLHRPAVLPAPAFAVRMAAGEMADALLLSSARVIPDRLSEAGFQWLRPTLEGALESILG